MIYDHASDNPSPRRAAKHTAPWQRPAPSPLCMARGADGARPVWRSTELASRWRAGAAGESSQWGEVRGGAGGLA
jgi:hypothetical protein